MDGDGLILIGPTAVLRVPGEADVGPLWDAVGESMEELRQWMSWFHEGYSESDVRRWVETSRHDFDADDDFNFVITERGAGAILGACGLNKVDHANRLANLGYWVRATATGNGTATEAAALLAHWALGELGLIRLEVVAATSNRPSQRVAEKLGATREGVARNRFWLGGSVHDAVVYSLVPADLGLTGAIAGEGRDEGVSSPV